MGLLFLRSSFRRCVAGVIVAEVSHRCCCALRTLGGGERSQMTLATRRKAAAARKKAATDALALVATHTLLAEMKVVLNPTNDGAWDAERVAQALELVHTVGALLLTNTEICGALEADGFWQPAACAAKMLKCRLENGWAAQSYGWFGVRAEAEHYRKELPLNAVGDDDEDPPWYTVDNFLWQGYHGQLEHTKELPPVDTELMTIVFTDYFSCAEKRVQLPVCEVEDEPRRCERFQFTDGIRSFFTLFRGFTTGVPYIMETTATQQQQKAEREVEVRVWFHYKYEDDDEGERPPRWHLSCKAGQARHSPASAVYGGVWTSLVVEDPAAEGCPTHHQQPSNEALDFAFKKIHSSFSEDEMLRDDWANHMNLYAATQES